MNVVIDHVEVVSGVAYVKVSSPPSYNTVHRAHDVLDRKSVV